KQSDFLPSAIFHTLLRQYDDGQGSWATREAYDHRRHRRMWMKASTARLMRRVEGRWKQYEGVRRDCKDRAPAHLQTGLLAPLRPTT
ncbi:hypothetical protein SPRG_16750, partial [Saprolegnia parasitica CBS 223.65]